MRFAAQFADGRRVEFSTYTLACSHLDSHQPQFADRGFTCSTDSVGPIRLRVVRHASEVDHSKQPKG